MCCRNMNFFSFLGLHFATAVFGRLSDASLYTPQSGVITFTSSQSWTVPVWVTQIFVELRGAAGMCHGGLGGYTSGYLDVSPGDILYITVDFGGGTSSQCVGVCSGGGAADIRMGGNDLM